MVSTINETKTPSEIVEWLRVWADGYEDGDALDDNDARQIADAVERVCAPGNAAAMREALENSLRFWNGISSRTRREENLRLEIAAALAAPARNCDRFQTEREAWDFYLAHTPDNGNIIDGFPTWLYATDPVYGDAAPNATLCEVPSRPNT